MSFCLGEANCAIPRFRCILAMYRQVSASQDKAMSNDLSPRLVMILLVKDEVDIVEQHICYHLRCGVDHVLAIDNGSSDGTREILSEYAKQGCVTLTDEPGQDYAQGRWVSRMAEVARDQLGADWVLASDADEFWWSPEGSLRLALPQRGDEADILRCDRYDMIGAVDRPTTCPWHKRLVYRSRRPGGLPRLEDPLEDELDQPYYYFALPTKAVFRADGLKAIKQGNHGAVFQHSATERSVPIVTYHFPIRSAAQFRRKIEAGAQAYARNTELTKRAGWHWRRWYRKLLTDGVDAAIADALPSSERIREDAARGKVVMDTTIKDLLDAVSVGDRG